MRFEWDERKNESNYRKHNVRFETATEVFDDPNCIFEQDRDVDGEERWQTIGRVGDVLLLIVAHTFGDRNVEDDEEVVRIISARAVNRRERKRYEDTN